MTEITSTRVIATSAEAAFNAARQIERFPEVMPDLEIARVLDDDGNGHVTSRWEGAVSVGPLKRKIAWTEKDYWDTDNLTCSFDLVEGDMKQYNGIWTFTPVDDGCSVELRVNFELGIPLLGPMVNRIIDQVMQDNCDALLEALEKLAKS